MNIERSDPDAKDRSWFNIVAGRAIAVSNCGFLRKAGPVDRRP
jgi:hypothetical protein